MKTDLTLSREIERCYCTSRRIVNILPTFLDLAYAIDLRAAMLAALREGNHSLLRMEILAGFIGCAIDVDRKQPIDPLIASALSQVRDEEPGHRRDSACARALREILEAEHAGYRSAESLAIRLDVAEGIELIGRALNGQSLALAFLRDREQGIGGVHAG